MGKEILHIWGPFSIQSYGLFMAIGIISATWLFLKNPKRKSIISSDQLSRVITLAIFVAIFGGRLLYVIEDYNYMSKFWDIFKIWEGGLSSLGAILSILLIIPIYLKRLKIPIIRFLDLTAVYAPIVETFARIGCFFAGCCYGTETNLPWAVIYKNTNCAAPAYTPIHPTQIYSSIAALLVFFIMRFILFKILKKPGQLLSMYLALTSISRFSIDFLRGDQTFFSNTGVLSIISTSQIISLAIFLSSIISMITIKKFSKNGNFK